MIDLNYVLIGRVNCLLNVIQKFQMYLYVKDWVHNVFANARSFVRTLCSFQVFEGKTVRIIQPFFVVISWDTFNVTGSRDQGLNPHSSVNKSVATMFVECGKKCPPFEYSSLGLTL